MTEKKHKKRLRPWVVTTLGVAAATLISVVGIKMIPRETVHADGDNGNDTVTITYDANGGTFDGGGTTNTVQYTKPDSNAVVKYSHTPNIADDGTVNGTYSAGYSNNDIVTIDGASKLYIDVWFSTMSPIYDWLAIYPSGVTPDVNNYSSATISGGKLGGGRSATKPTDEAYHKTYTVDGNTAQFFFRSDGSFSYYGYYGYYAAISDSPFPGTITSGEEKKPVRDGYRIRTWNTAADGSGTSHASFKDVPYSTDLTLYAQWEEHQWYEDWNYTLDDTNNLIVIDPSKPVDNTPDLVINDTANINGKNYKTTLKNTDGYQTRNKTIQSLTINGNVKFPENSSCLFKNFSSLKSLKAPNADLSEVTGAYEMFGGCSSLTTLDTSNWNLSALTNAEDMFFGCSSLTTIDTSNWGDMSSLTDAGYMFNGCSSLTTLDTSNWKLSALTDARAIFGYCSNLTTLDTSNWGDLSKVTNTSNMFGSCSNLTTLDTSKWDLSKVTYASNMLGGCSNLTTLDTSKWNLSALTDAYGMFFSCSSLTTLDTSKWNLSALTNAGYMFNGCSSLTTLDTSNWGDLSKVTNADTMFSSCSSLTTLDTSNWKLPALTDANSMFRDCSNLTSLDLTGFNTSKITAPYSDMGLADMFYGDDSLMSVTFGPSFSLKGNSTITDTSNMALLPSNQIAGYTGKWTKNDPDNHADAVTAEWLRDNYDPSTMTGTWVREKVSAVTVPIRFQYESEYVDDFDDYIVLDVTDSNNKSVTTTAVKTSDGEHTSGYTVDLEAGNTYKVDTELKSLGKYGVDSTYKSTSVIVDSSGKVTGDCIDSDGYLTIKLIYGGQRVPVRFKLDGNVIQPKYTSLTLAPGEYKKHGGLSILTVYPEEGMTIPYGTEAFEHVWPLDYTNYVEYVLYINGLESKYANPGNINLSYDSNGAISSSNFDSDGYVTINLQLVQYSVPVIVTNTADNQKVGNATVQIKDSTGSVTNTVTTASLNDASVTLVPGTYTAHVSEMTKPYPVPDDVTFNVAQDGTITDSSGKTITNVNLTTTLEWGPELPESGNRGALIITVIGCIGLAGIAIYLSTKKRPEENK